MKKNAIGESRTTVIDAIWNWAEVDVATVPIQQAESYYDRTMIFKDTEPPNKRRFNKISLRKHESTVIIYDGPGRTSSDWREIRLYQPSKRLR
jgi:hypothetical protein